MTTEQVRQDLECLQGFVEQNWSSHHCILSCMIDMHRAHQGYNYDSLRRNDDMIKALGFPGPLGPQYMFDWNDSGRTKQDILDRIDDALEGTW